MRNRSLASLNEGIKALEKEPFKPERLIISGKDIPYMRLEMPIEVGDTFSLLEAQTLYPKVYWEHPEDGTITGFGSSLELDEPPFFESDKGPRFFGGSDFMKRTGSNWGNFPESIYFLPLIEIEKRKDGVFLCINRTQDDLSFHIKKESSLPPFSRLINRLDSPPFPVWERNVSKVLEQIQKRHFLKTVLARSTQLEFEKPLSPYQVLKSLESKNRFSFQFSPDAAFIGASPETLYRRKHSHIESAAIAGTRPRGKTEKEDQILMKKLLRSSKEQREFEVVKNKIYEILSPLCKNLEIQNQQVLKTPSVQHLYQAFKGTLKKGIYDNALIQALHPTPAVGGFPKTIALNEIAQREAFDRGWYAAPIGWVSKAKAHHLVGIRSAFIQKNHLYLFAGTGIVEGSIPSKEWNELECKIQQYRSFL